MRNFVILFLIISSGLTAQERSSKENLKLFVKDYFNVINGKDSTSISTFLYDENVSWVGTYKQKTYEELSHHHHKLKPTFSGNFKNFLRCKDNYVSLNKKRWKYLKEKI